MRWISFAIIAVMCLTLHTTLAQRLAVWGAWPDAILVMVVFFGMHAKRWDAVIAGWTLGVMGDLASMERFGLLSLTYALVALAVQSSREWMFRYHPLTHFSVTFAAGLVTQCVFWMYTVMTTDSPAGQSWSVGPVAIAFYSGLCALPVHAVLLRMSSWLGLDAPRYTHARLRRIGSRSTVL